MFGVIWPTGNVENASCVGCGHPANRLIPRRRSVSVCGRRGLAIPSQDGRASLVPWLAESRKAQALRSSRRSVVFGVGDVLTPGGALALFAGLG